MKMMKVEMEFVVFATGDVITTSSDITGDDTLVKVIYLTPDSVYNYNDMAWNLGTTELLSGGIETGYIGYSGQVVDISRDSHLPAGTLIRYSIAGSTPTLDAEQRKALYTVSEGNTKEYNAVLSWLTAHRM